MNTSIKDQPRAIAAQQSVKNLPVNLFGSVMGLAGLSLAWRLASSVYGASTLIAEVVGIVAILAFIILASAYLVKWGRYASVVRAEFTHPIAGNFFGTISIGILLLSSVVASYSQALQVLVWSIGAVSTIVFSTIMIARLLKGNVDTGHVVPACLIPGVATLDITVAGGSLPMGWAHEVNLFAAGVGGILALIFFTMILSRLVHKEPLASAMVPSLMILIAPFEVGFLAYAGLAQRIDAFAALLFYFGLFLFLVLATNIFRSRNTYGPGGWAISFPMAALSNAALKYAAAQHIDGLYYLAAVILAILTLAIAVLFVRTLQSLVNGKLLG